MWLPQKTTTQSYTTKHTTPPLIIFFLMDFKSPDLIGPPEDEFTG
jgi:hypothetical protein